MNKEDQNFFADKDIQIILGSLLRVGVIASVSVVLIGGFVYLFFNHNHAVDYREFNPGKSGYASIAAILAGVKLMDGAAIVQFGTVLLIFTPIARVVFSVFSFLIERDYLYVLIGLFVLCVILFSLSDQLVG
ncbi:DUF1634 domain-containing protein [Pedobacter heparinus]|uniref:DUF1634 domain-containing protein n=1 Tax=Pedobacter heparinus TaxID=984 RepID=UPI0029302353|nr:DUF1634 domain-containing protein [Pedobacter heparinus]